MSDCQTLSSTGAASVFQRLWTDGFAHIGTLLSRADCARLCDLYDDRASFRTTIDMARFNFGRGQYRYFSYPLPSQVGSMRERFYECLAPIACSWNEALGLPADFPASLNEFLDRCHAVGQKRPTPLLLRYAQGDFNCLHQDLYGEIAFPFQVVVSLSEPGRDFEGGELLLVEQRPRAQSIGRAIRLGLGEGIVIPTRFRPIRGKRGFYRSTMRHGVSEVVAGKRHSLGIIFHDAA